MVELIKKYRKVVILTIVYVIALDTDLCIIWLKDDTGENALYIKCIDFVLHQTYRFCSFAIMWLFVKEVTHPYDLYYMVTKYQENATVTEEKMYELNTSIKNRMWYIACGLIAFCCTCCIVDLVLNIVFYGHDHNHKDWKYYNEIKQYVGNIDVYMIMIYQDAAYKIFFCLMLYILVYKY